MNGSTLITGGMVLTPGDTFTELDVVLADGRIDALLTRGRAGHARATSAETTIDAGGLLIAPGYIDLQINGGWGHDFTADPASIATVAGLLPSTGVTAFAPTIVSSSHAARRRALDTITALTVADGAAVPIGLHYEGPALSPARSGAHDRAQLRVPEPDETAGWSRATGVAIVTVAPEVDGVVQLARELTTRGIVVAIGHTECSAAEFARARAAGASLVTHLFNAMAPFEHRQPGPIGATFADPSIAASVICDGIHVDPIAVTAAWRALGAHRFVLVTDAMAALGSTTATARLGGVPVSVDETGVRTDDGTLAGSNLSLDRAVRNLIAFTGCTPAEAIRAASATPAEVAGLTDRGRIDVGARADLVLLDRDLHVVRTIIGGSTAWKS